MALDIDTLVEYTKRRLIAGQPEGSPWALSDVDLTANIPAARQLAATRIMRDPQKRQRLVQSYTLPLTSGAGDLTTAVGSITGVANELFLEGVEYGSVVDQDGNVVVWLEHFNDFCSPQMTCFDYYTITEQRSIQTRARNSGQVYTSADIVGIVGPLFIRASYCPANVNGFPPETEDDLVGAMVDLAMNKLPVR